MAHILITSGPTRQYLDPVRYLTNASSGRMGQTLSAAALEMGHQVTIVTGPVDITYPDQATVIPVVSTEEMLAAAEEQFAVCDGLIGVAAPCDYRPIRVQTQKITKTGDPLVLHLIETPDVVATLGAVKRVDQWVVGFALETEDARFRAIAKLEQKSCDLIVLNSPAAMHSPTTEIEILDKSGAVVLSERGDKQGVARRILEVIEQRVMGANSTDKRPH